MLLFRNTYSVQCTAAEHVERDSGVFSKFLQQNNKQTKQNKQQQKTKERSMLLLQKIYSVQCTATEDVDREILVCPVNFYSKLTIKTEFNH